MQRGLIALAMFAMFGLVVRAEEAVEKKSEEAAGYGQPQAAPLYAQAYQQKPCDRYNRPAPISAYANANNNYGGRDSNSFPAQGSAQQQHWAQNISQRDYQERIAKPTPCPRPAWIQPVNSAKPQDWKPADYKPCGGEVKPPKQPSPERRPCSPERPIPRPCPPPVIIPISPERPIPRPCPSPISPERPIPRPCPPPISPERPYKEEPIIVCPAPAPQPPVKEIVVEEVTVIPAVVEENITEETVVVEEGRRSKSESESDIENGAFGSAGISMALLAVSAAFFLF